MSTAGARSRSSIPSDRLEALNTGLVASRTLAEVLAIDQSVLMRHAHPNPSAELYAAVDQAQHLGILKRMQRIGALVRHSLDAAQLDRLAVHPSDTVRGWVCFAAVDDSFYVADVLRRVRPFADDEHFAVREWAWMASRPALAADLDKSIALLVAWTHDDSERIRRFASEVLRPRGVWATHIAALKCDPARALPILTNLRADPSRYVQDSVANWINDAAKSNPQWAQDLCARWLAEQPSAATQRIVQRGLRSL